MLSFAPNHKIMNRTIVIQGSSRGDGNTEKVVQFFSKRSEATVINLSEKNIGHFDYNYENQEDDFLPLIKDILLNYDTLIFATPVYWYSMSGMMKVFFDRISDLLTIHKELGRKLRGKNMGLIICSSGPGRIDTFPEPFKASAEYLGMNYIGDVHTWIEHDKLTDTTKKNIVDFISKIPTFKEK